MHTVDSTERTLANYGAWWAAFREEGSTTLSMKAGTLDDTSVVAPTSHLWTKRAQPWLAPVLNGAVCHETEPDSEDALRRQWRDAGGGW